MTQRASVSKKCVDFMRGKGILSTALPLKRHTETCFSIINHAPVVKARWAPQAIALAALLWVRCPISRILNKVNMMNRDKLPKHVINYMHKEGIWGRVYIPVPEHIKNKSQRNETIIKMAEHGVSKTTIARKMDVSRTTVYNVLNEREQG